MQVAQSPVTRLSAEHAQWLGKSILPHEPALRCWLSRKRFQDIDVDDVIQETYAILANLESFQAVLNPRAYAFATAFSIVKAQLRRDKIASIRGVDNIAELAGEDARPSPETEVCDRDELQRLAAAIAQLPTRCRAVFVMRKLEGLSQKEVARALGVSEGTVEKHMQKGLLVLAAKFERGGSGPARASLDRDGQPASECRGYANQRNRGGDRHGCSRLGRAC